LKYRLVYTRRAIKDIQRLEPYAIRLTESKLGTYRFRIGDYRAIFDLEGNEIVVLRVGHRRDIYKR